MGKRRGGPPQSYGGQHMRGQSPNRQPAGGNNLVPLNFEGDQFQNNANSYTDSFMNPPDSWSAPQANTYNGGQPPQQDNFNGGSQHPHRRFDDHAQSHPGPPPSHHSQQDSWSAPQANFNNAPNNYDQTPPNHHGGFSDHHRQGPPEPPHYGHQQQPPVPANDFRGNQPPMNPGFQPGFGGFNASPPQPVKPAFPEVPEGFPDDPAQIQFPRVQLQAKEVLTELCRMACFPPPLFTVEGTMEEKKSEQSPWTVDLTCGYQTFKAKLPIVLKKKTDAEKVAYELLLLSLYPQYTPSVEGQEFSNFARNGKKRNLSKFHKDIEEFRQELEASRNEKIAAIQKKKTSEADKSQAIDKLTNSHEFAPLLERRNNIDFPPYEFVDFYKDFAAMASEKKPAAPESWATKLETAVKHCKLQMKIETTSNEEEEAMNCIIRIDKKGQPNLGTFDQFLFKINHRKHLPEDFSKEEHKELEKSIKDEARQMALHRLVNEGEIESVDSLNKPDSRRMKLWKLFFNAQEEAKRMVTDAEKFRDKLNKIRTNEEFRRKAEWRRKNNPRETDKMTKEEKKAHFKQKAREEREKQQAEDYAAGPPADRARSHSEAQSAGNAPAPGMDGMGGPPSIFGGPGLPPPRDPSMDSFNQNQQQFENSQHGAQWGNQTAMVNSENAYSAGPGGKKPRHSAGDWNNDSWNQAGQQHQHENQAPSQPAWGAHGQHAW